MSRLALLLALFALSTNVSFAQAAEHISEDLTSVKPQRAVPPYIAAPASSSLALLFDNGPLLTGTGNGVGGANTSAIGQNYGSTLFGLGQNARAASPQYISDDFTVPAGTTWTIDDMQFFGYQTGSTAAASTITELFVQIWDGPPNEPSSTVIFGDLETDVLIASEFSGIYRVTQADLLGPNRPIYRNTAFIGTILPAGTYWVQWGMTGSLTSGPWQPPVSVNADTPPPGNGLQFSGGVWQEALDGSQTGPPAVPGTIPVAFPFLVNGTAGTPNGSVLTVAPSNLTFGSVSVGQTETRTVTLTSVGSAPVNISSIVVSGAGFSLNQTGTSTTLASNQSTTFEVIYTPTAATTNSGAVTIMSNATTSSFLVTLIGEGNTNQTSTIPPGTTVGGPTFARPDDTGAGTPGSCTLNSTDATAVSYATQQFTVTEGGPYSLFVASSAELDAVNLLYRGMFSAASPCANLIALTDVGGGGTTEQTDVTLTPGTYTLVVTGFTNADAGTYTGTVVGPNTVTFPVSGETGAGSSTASLVAFPNPMHGSSSVRFTADASQDVSVVVYDVTGRQVATLFQGAVVMDQEVSVALDASSLPAGVYVVRATGTTLDLTQRVTVVR